MKILVFEYITGGGLAGQDLPVALAAEGRMMLQALLDDLKSLSGIELILPLDQRCMDFALPANTCVVPIGTSDDIQRVLPELIAQVDTVWPIAPEIDDILFDLTRLIENHEKCVLSSPSRIVAVAADKLRTYRYLTRRGIDAVPTELFQKENFDDTGKRVIKPIDGMGCQNTFVIDGSEELAAIISKVSATKNHIIQPYVEGSPISLCCLFRQGKGWLLCINKQDIRILGRQFRLVACQVNVPGDREAYQVCVDKIAQAMPELWGYAGIDLIETPEGFSVLEINPRMTTSYVGVHQALGINVAEQVLRMLTDDPVPMPGSNQQITVSIDGDLLHA